MVFPIWKLDLQPASYNGAEFHVEVQTRNGGRRIAMHQFPKRDIPYAEDMGRSARGFILVGYVIGDDYEIQRDLLIEQLELEGNGQLILPTSFDQKIVVCDRYSVTERREQGGYAEISMGFSEAGIDPSTITSEDTQATVNSTANSVTGGPSFQDSTNTFMQSSDITAIV